MNLFSDSLQEPPKYWRFNMEKNHRKLQEKLSMLHVKKMMEKVDGINLLAISNELPNNSEWILKIEDKNICTKDPKFKFPYKISKEDLAKNLNFISSPKKEFLTIYYDYIPIYIHFQIINLVKFLRSYSLERKSLDITLFCLNEQEVIDIHTEENDIEVRVMPIFDY